jgi:hypothetical protein
VDIRADEGVGAGAGAATRYGSGSKKNDKLLVAPSGNTDFIILYCIKECIILSVIENWYRYGKNLAITFSSCEVYTVQCCVVQYTYRICFWCKITRKAFRDLCGKPYRWVRSWCSDHIRNSYIIWRSRYDGKLNSKDFGWDENFFLPFAKTNTFMIGVTIFAKFLLFFAKGFAKSFRKKRQNSIGQGRKMSRKL